MPQKEYLNNPILLIFVLGFISLLLHSPFMKLPPVGTHVFRQAHTMSVARNFATETIDISKPRVDRRYETNGVTGANFPLYEWGLGMLWRITGISEFVQRSYSFFWYLIAISGAVFFFYTIFASTFQRILASSFFAFSPEIFYHAINALPDIAALAFATWAMYFFYTARLQNSSKYLLWSALCFWIMALIKIYFITIVILPSSFLLLGFIYKQIPLKNFIFYMGISVLLFVSILAWYVYADYLIQYNGLYEFGLHTRQTESLSSGLEILLQNLWSDLPELLLGYPAIVLFLVSTVYFLGNIKKIYAQSIWFWPLILWVIGTAIVHFFLLEQMRFHNYYMMPYILPLVVFAVMGVGKISFFSKPIVYILLALGSMLWGAFRIIPARWTPNKYAVSENILDPKTRQELTQTKAPSGGFSLVGPDYSGCIFFYYFDKKGAIFNDYEQLLEKDSMGQSYLQRMVQRGATELLLQSPPVDKLNEIYYQLPGWETVYNKNNWILLQEGK
jgi:hypothetical protein